MTDKIELKGKALTSDPAMEKVIAARAGTEELRRYTKALEADRKQLLDEYNDMKNARPVPRSRPVSEKPSKSESVRVTAGDVHGMMMDRAAVDAFLRDVKTLNPNEVVLGGDIVECGGWLAKHFPIGFVATCDYSYQEDVRAASWFLDELQKAAPNACLHYLEGNHEDRVERWCVDQTMSHGRDADFLRRAFSPFALLRLEERGIPYYRRTEIYGAGLPRGWMKIGRMFFTHALAYSKNAARDAAIKTAGNVTYFCCFSPDTEIMASTGWKLFEQLATGESVLTMNKETGYGEWQIPSQIVRRSDKSEYIHFQTLNADILVTPDHAMATINRQTREEDPLEERLPIRRIPAEEVEGKRFAIPLSTVPDPSRPDFPILDDMLRLVGWVVTEGYYEQQGSVRIAQSDRPDGSILEIEGILTRLGVPFSKFLVESKGEYRPHDGRTANYDSYSFYLPRKSAAVEELKRLVPEKSLRGWMIELSPRQFRILFDTLIWADGSENKDCTEHCVQFSTNKEIDRDIFQMMCALNGYRTSSVPRIRSEGQNPVFAISACSRGFCHINPERSHRIPTGGADVWCVVVPNQTLVLRRAGKVFVCGNTHREDTATVVFPGVGIVKAFNPGCLCQMQPIWKHSDPTSWSQGYGIDFIARSGSFLRVHVPIWRGESLAGSMVDRFKN